MVRSACCVKASIKKGPWTPEEDIVLVSYIKEHGPGNWRLVPTSTGLMRCSKSCRLRWTNYLRPGIKRGNFTPHEEGIIVQLQALLGNRWAAIASYLPQRTDNDIKNYWNTHLKKKLKKYQFATNINTQSDSGASSSHEIIPSISSNPPAAAHIPSTYASSAENISRLLEGWMRSSPNHTLIPSHDQNLILEHQMKKQSNGFSDNQLLIDGDFNLQMITGESVNEWGKIEEKFGFEEGENNKEFTMMEFDQKMRLESQNLLEKWLFEENAGRGGDALLEISGAGCCSEDMF